MDGLTFPAFGLGVRLSFELPAIDERAAAPYRPTLDARYVPRLPEHSESAIAEHVWSTRFDGQPYSMHRLRDGSHRFDYGERASFHLSSDGRLLRCAVAEPDEPAWQRLFLDTILWSCSILHEFELLHASAVAWPRGALAIAAMTGGGKTSVAAELVRRGAALLCDDVLAVERVGGRLAGHPSPPVMNLPPTGPAEIGRELARFSDESWIAVDNMAREPRPLDAICLLERRSGAALSLERFNCTLLDLLPHTLALSATPRRAARRFDVFSQVAIEVPVYRLTADLDVSPVEIADLIESRLGTLSSSAAVA